MSDPKVYDALVRLEYDYENEYGDSRRGWVTFVGEWHSNVPVPAMINKIASELESQAKQGETPDQKNLKNFIVTNYNFEEAIDV
ncbi:hypothetical protein KNV00_gp090 [Streptomyces phage Bmoc]|uniref:Uncharacterized protein n=1 Tax=Streptomyces phage Bmoc TaxID=2725629 RepID=A0A6M3SZ41_9CAUD|nr:hypothetical protein KNV00_gp090 [Streptomyces phage Bmoc]QJD50929.1 hypothetical protein SEA_BMOC_220 [Streptomyces phage Bmoc]